MENSMKIINGFFETFRKSFPVLALLTILATMTILAILVIPVGLGILDTSNIARTDNTIKSL